MTHQFSRSLNWLIDSCTDFGMYLATMQRQCSVRNRVGGCEGGPTVDEAREDYRRMIRPSFTSLIG